MSGRLSRGVPGRRVCTWAMLAGLLSGVCAHAEPSRVRNGGFEQTADSRPVHWTCTPAGQVRSTGQAHQGRHALVLEARAGAKRYPVCQQYVAARPRHTYRLTFWYKAENIRRPADRPTGAITIARLIERDEDGDWVSDPAKPARMHKFRDVLLRDPAQAPGDWTRVELRSTTNDEATQFQVLFQLVPGTGRLYVDDVVLEELAGLVGAWPKERLDGTAFNTVRTDVVTPHQVWAKPWVRGTTRALVIVPKTGMREVAELAQRMDLAFDTVVTWSPSYLGLADSEAKWRGTSTIEKVHQLQTFLRRRYDAIVVANFAWAQLPEEVRYRIFQQVHAGTGLVLVFEQEKPLRYELDRLFKQPCERGRAFLTRGFPFGRLRWGYVDSTHKGTYVRGPRRDAPGLVRTCRLGRGRCVVLTYPYPDPMKHKAHRAAYGGYGGTGLTPFLTYTGSTYRHYEWYHVLLARAVLWAAGKDAGIYPASDDPVTLPAGRGREFILRLASDRDPGEPLRCLWSLRDAWGLRVQDGEAALRHAHGQAAARLTLPALPSGPHAIEYRIMARDKVAGFGVVPVAVTGDVTITRLDVARPDGPTRRVQVTVQVSGPGAARAVARLTDNHDRVVADSHGPIHENKATLDLAVPPPVTTLHRLDVRVEGADGRPLSAEHRELCVPGAPRPDFDLALWGSTDGTYVTHLQDWAYHTVYGINSIYLTKCIMDIRFHTISPKRWRLANTLWPQTLGVLRTGAEPIPWFISVLSRASTPVRKPCLTDPAYIKKSTGQVEAGARFLGQRGLAPAFATFGDEFLLAYPNGPDYCFSPTCKADFRRYLRTVYGSLDALNAQWGTRLASWDQAEPITLKQARQTQQHARWADHRLHMDRVVLDHLKRCCAIVRQHMPGTRIGYEGMFRSYSECGYDVERILGVVDYLNSYAYPYRPVTFRGLSRPGSLTGMFCNGVPKEGCRWHIWRLLANNMFHAFWWRADSISGCFSYDMTPVSYRGMPEVSRAVRELRGGIAALVRHARRVDEPVAFLYSQPSIHASKLYGHQDDILDAQVALTYLLDDLRVGYTMVGSGTVGQPDWWHKRGIQVLVLPYVQAVTPAVAQGITAFCRAGGTVLADVRPGVLDGHCTFARTGRLDRLFGVRRTGDVPLRTATHPDLGNLQVDPGVRLTSGKAQAQADGVPILITHTVGRGRAALLNFRATAYDVKMKTADVNLTSAMTYKGNEPLLATVGKLLSEVGVGARVRLLGASAGLRLVECAKWQRHGTTLLGLVRHYLPVHADLTELQVGLAEPAHVYDLRRRRYLGRCDRFAGALPVGDAALFALLPYRVDGLDVQAHATKVGEPMRVRVRVRGGGDGPKYHVVLVNVLGPDGRERPWYATRLVLDGHEAAGAIPLALSDPSGVWEIRARDAISHIRDSCRVAVQGR